MIGSATVRPRSLSQPAFDLSTVDTPEEAMVMPGCDLWVGLVLGPLPGRVTVTSDDQVMTYEQRPSNQPPSYSGQLNGQPFQLDREPIARGWRTFGDTPAGPIDSSLMGGHGGFGFIGQAGDIEVSTSLALDQSNDGFHLAYMSGQVGGQNFAAKVVKSLGQVEVYGKLGEQPLRQTITMGPHQEWQIASQIGSVHYTEVIERL
ncbi:MAG: hypothetical protein KC910_24330 [Candidatus Eremiobacteraeota bacterium]|nr:hypothetical protein [Candidatus Eremiobacteraeota bacterium]